MPAQRLPALIWPPLYFEQPIARLVYDADDLRGRGDGGPEDQADADPDALHVFEVWPGGLLMDDLLEGEGTSAIDDDAAEGVRAIPIVLEGQNMTDATVITVDGAGFEGDEVEAVAVAPRDPKTALQEWAQGRGFALPAYRTVSSEGPSHRPRFTVAVSVGAAEAEAAGVTKREAEKAAAAALLARLEAGA